MDEQQQMIPGPPMDPRLADPRVVRQHAIGRKLVLVSRLAGWGGVALFCLSPVLAGWTVATAILAAGGAISAVAGAVVGQIGRGLQGRVI